ncbi:MAG: Hsp20/alpha crystallin family protein [Sulfurimonas sp.]
MKRLPLLFILGALFSATLSAGTLFVNDPYKDEITKMREYMNSLVDSHMNAAAISNYNYPRTNIQNKNDEIIIDFDLAGVDKKDINLSIDDHNILKLEGSKKQKIEEKDKEGKYIRKEIFFGSFQKVIQLPENIDSQKLKTTYKNGILHITIPKKAVKKPKVKMIPIN